MWYIELDKKYKCMHVNLVESSNVAKEAEFLFVPYSTFTVSFTVAAPHCVAYLRVGCSLLLL